MKFFKVEGNKELLRSTISEERLGQLPVISVERQISLSSDIGPGSSSGKELGNGLNGLGSIPGVGGVEIFLHSFVSRLVLDSTSILKMSTRAFPGGKVVRS